MQVKNVMIRQTEEKDSPYMSSVLIDEKYKSEILDPRSKKYLLVQFMRHSLMNVRVNSALISMELHCCGYFKSQRF